MSLPGRCSRCRDRAPGYSIRARWSGWPAVVLESKRIESDGAGWCYDHVAAAAVGEAGVVIGEAVAGGERGVAVVGGAVRQNATLEAHGAAGVIDGATGGADAGVGLVARKRAVGDSQRAVVTDGAAKAEAERAGGLVGRKRAVGDGQRAVVIDGAAKAVGAEGLVGPTTCCR